MDKGVQIFTLNADAQSSLIIALQLTQAPVHTALRLTGGFGSMSEEDGRKGIEFLTAALSDFKGALIYGGTRVVQKSNPMNIHPTLGEVPYRIKELSPEVQLLGIVPRMDIFRLVPGLGMVISEDEKSDQLTLIHPIQDMCLQVQQNVDDFVPWEAEVREAIRIIGHLHNHAKWHHAMLVYNGGEVVRKEIPQWAELGWPVILVKGSGRAADEFARNSEWLSNHPNVIVVDHDIQSLRNAIQNL